jgi:hypothetical protein
VRELQLIKPQILNPKPKTSQLYPAIAKTTKVAPIRHPETQLYCYGMRYSQKKGISKKKRVKHHERLSPQSIHRIEGGEILHHVAPYKKQ